MLVELVLNHQNAEINNSENVLAYRNPNEIFTSVITITEESEDTKWVIRIRKWKKNRQHNGRT